MDELTMQHRVTVSAGKIVGSNDIDAFLTE